MLLAFFVCGTIAISIANPFHKYPYVFLLDVGNEELEKTNTEQLRVSVPGGSLAMKYPVLGEGDTISYVRISGIDFGTDLKVNILDGGPGYKYVILVFMGNPGVNYDAVVTLQTLPIGEDADTVKAKQSGNGKVNFNSNSYEESDTNSDGKYESLKANSKSMKKYNEKSNSELMQSSSTFYNYANNEMTDDEDEDEATSAEEQDDDEDSYQTINEDDDENVEEKTYKSDEQKLDIPRAEDADNSDDNKPADIVHDSLKYKYQDLKPYFANGLRIYPQSSFNNRQFQVNYGYDKEDPVEIEQIFNDEEVDNDENYKDGTNTIDSDYEAAEY